MNNVILVVGEIIPGKKIEIRAHWPNPEGRRRAMEDEQEFIRTGMGSVSYSSPRIPSLKE